MKAISEAGTSNARLSNRVLVVSDAAPGRNGVGSYYADLLPDLDAHVAAIDLICPRIANGRWQGGFTFPMPGDATQRICLPNVVSLKRRMAAFEPDTVIIPTPGPYGIFGARIAERLGARVLVGFHTWYEKLSELYWNRIQGHVTQRYFEISNRMIFRHAHCVLGNSPEMLDIARRIGARRTHLMGTPISQLFVNNPPRLPERLTRIVFAGRLAAEKNLEVLIEAARALPKLQVSIAGDGPQRAMVESAASELPNLSYRGWLSRQQLIECVDAHDALVLPSHVESFGTVAIEAMARQRLVIVSDQCGIAQWPDLGHALAQFGKGVSLIDALQGLAGLSEFEISGRAKRARRAALSHHRWNRDGWLGLIGEA